MVRPQIEAMNFIYRPLPRSAGSNCSVGSDCTAGSDYSGPPRSDRGVLPHSARCALLLLALWTVPSLHAAKPPAPGDYRVVAGQVDHGTFNGWLVFHTACYGCHGTDATGTDLAPNLLQSVKAMTPRAFATKVVTSYRIVAQDSDDPAAAREALLEEVVRKERGKRGQIVMPAWEGDRMVDAHLLDLFAYLSARADGQLAPGRPRLAAATGGKREGGSSARQGAENSRALQAVTSAQTAQTAQAEQAEQAEQAAQVGQRSQGVQEAPAVVPSGPRGELLYATHCVSCHSAQMHWRERKAATDWASLQVQVRRWQGNASLGWGEADIRAVAHYLNQRYYRFPRPAEPLARARARPVGLASEEGGPGACRAWGVEAEYGPSEDSFCRVRRPIAAAMGQEAGEKWTAAAKLQPTIPKPDRLLGTESRASRADDAHPDTR